MRLKKRKEFLRVAQEGSYARMPSVVVQLALPEDRLGFSRLGVTATRRVGSAVVRNRCKRRLRAAFSDLLESTLSSVSSYQYDIVLIAVSSTERVEFSLLKEHILAGLQTCLRFLEKRVKFSSQQREAL